MIKCQWSVKHLKANIGGQSKIYVRRIQTSLSIKPVMPETVVNVKQMCKGCNEEFPMLELRDHLYTRTAGIDSSTDSDASDGNNTNATKDEPAADLAVSAPVGESAVLDGSSGRSDRDR